MKRDQKFEKLRSCADERRDTQGGTYDVDPALATDSGQGEFGGQMPEGMMRERKGPLGKTTGRH